MNSPVRSKKFFIAQEVAQILGISKQTLFRYEKKGISQNHRGIRLITGANTQKKIFRG